MPKLSNIRIAIFGRAIAPQAMALAEQSGATVITTDGYLDADEVVRFMAWERPHGAILRLGQIGAQAIAAAPDLRIIAKHGVGYDTIDLDAANRHEVLVSIATGANAISVAEQALALTLAAARGIAHLDSRIRSGHWDKASYLGTELHGKILGIVGLGAIGRHLAEICCAMGMSIVVFDPALPDLATAAFPFKRLGSLDELLIQSDVVSLHCPLTAATRNLISTPQFALMKPGAILVNTARGGLVDLDALCLALRDRQIGGAGLDTFPVEPPVLSPELTNLPNLVVSPHVGASTEEAGQRVGLTAMGQVIDYLSGKPISQHYVVNDVAPQLAVAPLKS